MASSRASSSTSGTSPVGGGGIAPEPQRYDGYRPIRRISQACNACRRRKSRCTGGHPCRSCRRLAEPCEYPPPGGRVNLGLQRAANDRLPHANLSEPSVIPQSSVATDRLNVLETRLDDISRQLGQLTELTRQLCASRTQSNVPPPRDPLVAGTMTDQSTTYGSPTPIYAARGPNTREGAIGRFSDPFHPPHWAVKLEHLIPDHVTRAVFRDYFKFAHNQPYSFFHESTFWEKFEAGRLPDHLLLAVLSHALRFSGDQFFKDRTRSMSILFANMSWKSIVYLYFQERADADLAAVQTITLLSIYDFTAGHDRHDAAWVKIGLAVRMAQDLRLMMDDSTTLENTEKEERRRVFWSVYMLDRLASCARARPPGVLEASCHLSLPCEEQLWRTGFPSNDYKLDDVTKNNLPVDRHPGYPALVIAMTSIVGRCSQCMIQNSSGRPRQAPWDQNSDFATICSELLTCEGYFEQPIKEALELNCAADDMGIDPALAGPLVFSHTLFLLSHCFLYQPVLLRERVISSHGKPPQTFLSRGLDSAHEYAKRLVHLLRDAKQAGYQPLASFYGYCLVVAAGIHAIGISSSKESVREEATICLSLCREMVSELAQYWASCMSMSHMLEKLSRNSHRYAQLTNPAGLLGPLDNADRDLMWSFLDYNTICNEPAPSRSRPASPTSYDTSLAGFDAMQTSDFGNFFPEFSIPGLHGGSPPRGPVDYDTIMMVNPPDMTFAGVQHPSAT